MKIASTQAKKSSPRIPRSNLMKFDRKPENKRPVTDIVRYEKVIVRHKWFFVRQHINTSIGETVC
jgi:hypothetical protein